MNILKIQIKEYLMKSPLRIGHPALGVRSPERFRLIFRRLQLKLAMTKMAEFTGIFLLFLYMISCSTTKYIPDGKYLLDEISIRTDSNSVSEAELLAYIRQTPNSPKLGLKIYNMVENDSNWFKRMIRKIGEPPVIFNQNLTNQSITELSIEMKNRGYLNAHVHAVVDSIEKKASVNYHVHEGEPYRVRNYKIDLADSTLNDLVSGNRRRQIPDSTRQSNWLKPFRQRNTNQRNRRSRPVISQGTIFSMNTLEQERTRVSSILRNTGYYASTLNNLHYLADTTLRSNEVDLTMIVNDSSINKIYRIEKVKVFSGYDPTERWAYRVQDSLENKGITIYYDSLRFLRPNVIADKVLVRAGSAFRERAVESTYSLFQTLDCVNRVNIEFKEGNYPDSTLLDCEIYLTPGNVHSLRTGIEGTNKAGDLGVALDVNYGHLNLFNGSEIFNINMRAAYEFVDQESSGSLNNNYYEFGIMPSIIFPKIHLPFVGQYVKDRYNAYTQYSLGLNVQRRPQFTRDFFNFNWKVSWSGRRSNLTHSLSLLDLNFIFMPWKSADFQDFFNNLDPLSRPSYENIFTAGVNYNLRYSNNAGSSARPNLYTIRFNIETSGNLLNGISSLVNAEKNESGQYTILNNPYAQYVRADFDFSQAINISSNSTFAYHAGLGVALPYGNSTIMPFEKRYYGGGPNHVRGWRTRYFGPGAYNPGTARDITSHVGDINFISSVEYRYKVMKWLEPAFFIDCGNIWTIKDYPNQQGGLFQWDSFYKELAVGTGIGLRLDFSFLIFRIDAATRVYDPERPEGDRFVFFKNKIMNNSSLYLAIGYPF